MNIRKMENIGVDTSLLGLGLMRLPIKNDNPADIEVDEAVKMIRYAIDNGVNYLDTAWVYHGGESETVTGIALKDGYREKAYVATKSPTWLLEKESDWEMYLNLQLEKLQIDQIDFYLQHSLERDTWNDVKKYKMYDKAKKAKEEGKIKYYGFSFHDDIELFKEIINEYDWDFCQIQLNYLDTNYQAGLEGLRIAKEKNIPVIIMEPLRGGMLTTGLPLFAKEKMKNAKVQYRPVEWAFKYLADLEGVTTILSGMSTYEQIEDNINIFSSSMTEVGNMSEEETLFINELVEEWEKRAFIKCTKCAYCMPCPKGVDIPKCFGIYNYQIEGQFDSTTKSKLDYKKLVENNLDALRCVKCGACEKVCPQGISIIKRLEEIKEIFKEEE